ncbi:MAG TPA: beta-propeller fold lactonase family protein [Caulobacteraceae bacterium]|nr:beta-propeller fold lactonase family protein [Caulobacteraceae bacterium]
MNRRKFNVALAGASLAAVATRAVAKSRARKPRVALYNTVGARLTHYDVDVEAATLTQRATLPLPSIIQYVWPHPTDRYLYASTSDAVPGALTVTGNVHRLCAVSVGRDGAVSMHGEPAVLSQRPINNSVDATGRYAFTCYSAPANLSVNTINADGTVGPQIAQAAKLDLGIFPHQIRALPSNRSVVMVTRGINANAKKPEYPGALKLFTFDQGQLAPLQSIAVGGKGGYGYGPRHLDFHPTQPWVYVALERENQLMMHHIVGDGFAPEPSFVKTTTSDTTSDPALTLAGAIHVHPRGHTVYVSNRASNTVPFNGKPVFAGGENSIAVFSIDPATGEPTLVQHIDPQGFHVRAFTIDPTGKLLVAATMLDMWVRDGEAVRHVPAALSVFRIGDDGRLTFVRKYDVETTDQDQQLWVRMMTLPV